MRPADRFPLQLVSFRARYSPALDEIGFCAWIAAAAPGDGLIYHRGFLAVDTMSVMAQFLSDDQRRLKRIAAAALSAFDEGLVHLVQERFGPDDFAYIAIARPKPRASTSSFCELLLAEEAA